jgi:FG-GAP-like repeat/FG-GAP repeat
MGFALTGVSSPVYGPSVTRSRHTSKAPLAGLLVVSLLMAMPLVLAPRRASAQSALRNDYNGDGFADLAVAVRFESVGTTAGAGAVNVLYGSAGGLTAAGDQYFTQATAGVPSPPREFEGNGLVVKGADLDRDGYSDLVIGWPHDTVWGITRAGSVIVLRGSPAGLTTVGSQIWTQSTTGIPGDPTHDEEFGGAIAVGNFDADGYPDVAVGAAFDRVFPAADFGHGSVTVIRGSPTGLTSAGAKVFTKGTPGVPGTVAQFDRFGASLAAANFGRGPQTDLAIGAPWDDEAAPEDGGAAFVLYGSAIGLTGTSSQRFSQATPGISDGTQGESDEEFGASLAAANFGRSSHADLALGVPKEVVDEACYSGDGSALDTGAVHVLYGANTGLSASGAQFWTMDTPGVAGSLKCEEQFGWVLAVGNLGKSGQADLTVGQPQRGFCKDGGAISILYGSTSGITADGSRYLSQKSPGVPGEGGCSDIFGSSLFTGRIRGNATADLAIGAPCAGGDINGVVNVLFGSSTGITTQGAQRFSQLTPGVAGSGEFNAQFASALSGGPQAIFC